MIEILAVVAIVAIIAALALPVYQNLQARGASAKCVSNLRTLGTAINLYVSENNGNLPGPATTGMAPKVRSNTSNLLRFLAPYLGVTLTTSDQFLEVARCPAAKAPSPLTWRDITMYITFSLNDLPPSGPAYFNAPTNSIGAGIGPWGRTTTGDPGWKAISLRDRINPDAKDPSGAPLTLASIPAIYEVCSEFPGKNGGNWPWPVPAKPAHGATMNVLFFDWHVGQVKPGTWSSKGG